MRCYLISRDNRTQGLFRNCWFDAISKLGFQVDTTARYELGTVKAIKRFVQNRKKLNLIFGTSEICLYAPFSVKGNIWAFTGLGRLLSAGKISSLLILLYLRCFYRGQLIVTLNQHDEMMLKHFFGEGVTRINGEGYTFDSGVELFPRTKKKDQPINYVYHGRLLKSKGVDQIIELFETKKLGNLDLYGDFDFGNSDAIDYKYQEYAKNDGAAIKIFPFDQDIRQTIAKYDVFISLSKREGLPFAVLDALNAGLYVLLSKVPGHTDFDGLSGVYVGELSEIEAHLEEIALNPDIVKISASNRESRMAALEQSFGTATVKNQITKLLEMHTNMGVKNGNHK